MCVPALRNRFAAARMMIKPAAKNTPAETKRAEVGRPIHGASSQVSNRIPPSRGTRKMRGGGTLTFGLSSSICIGVTLGWIRREFGGLRSGTLGLWLFFPRWLREILLRFSSEESPEFH